MSQQLEAVLVVLGGVFALSVIAGLAIFTVAIRIHFRDRRAKRVADRLTEGLRCAVALGELTVNEARAIQRAALGAEPLSSRQRVGVSRRYSA